MEATNNLELIAEDNFEKALSVIKKSGVRQAWEAVGATVNQVGSMAMGLLMKHRDKVPDPNFRVFLNVIC